MAEQPSPRTPLEAIDFSSLTDEELQRLYELTISEKERRMAVEPGSEDAG
jgi:hypothetical protein